MGDDKANREYFAPGAETFNYNNVTGGADSASGGSGGSGMDCLPLRSPPSHFHYLISEQAKSLVALQELQNEVGALLEFRDLVIETFPNLRSKMAPSTPSGGARRDWEPGVRVRRKLAGGGGDAARTKPQPSVQDSGFSTETSCGKDAHSSSASATATAHRERPLEDELWALLDVIQRKGGRLRDEAEALRGEMDERHDGDGGHDVTAEESFARALDAGCGDCGESELRRLRRERDVLLATAARLEADAAARTSGDVTPPPLGRLDAPLEARAPRVPAPDSKKVAAILLESNPVELQRQLLTTTVQNQVLCERLKRAAAQRTALLQRLEQARDHNDDLRFRLEEKNIELEGARARVRQLEQSGSKTDSLSLDRDRDRARDREAHSSMRDMEPLALPDDGDVSADVSAAGSHTPRRRPSRIPLHTAHKGTAPRPPVPSNGGNSVPSRPPSAHSVRSVRSAASTRTRRDSSAPGPPSARKDKSAVPVRRSPSAHDNKPSGDELAARALAAEYVARASRLADAPLFSRLGTVRTRPLPADLLLECRLAYETPQNLALELHRSILYENIDSIDVKNLKSMNSHGEDSLWNGKPQQYFESINCAKEYENDSLAPS